MSELMKENCQPSLFLKKEGIKAVYVFVGLSILSINEGMALKRDFMKF
jgi:hypothetical protein